MKKPLSRSEIKLPSARSQSVLPSLKRKESESKLHEQPSSYLDIAREKNINVEQILKTKDKEIKKLQYIISYLELGIKKREELAKMYFEENSQLKDELKSKNKLIDRLREDVRDAMSSTRYSSPLKTRDSLRVGQTFEEKLFPTPTQAYYHSSNHETSSPQHNGALHSAQGNHSPAFPHGTQHKHLNDKALRAVTVTETQGLKDIQSLFLGRAGRVSILLMNDAEALQMMNNPKVIQIEELLADDDDLFLEKLASMNTNVRFEVLDTLKSVFKDFRNLLKVVLSMKKLIRASNSISVSLILSDALETIVHETCDILNCDRASVFIVDEANHELWSKVAKGSSSTIRIPLEKGIIGHVATTGKSVRIDDAYLDPKFNRAIDLSTNYRTRTILCVPVKDYTGKVIGVCQAINKLDGSLFTADDEGLMTLLANQAGVMIKNSMQFDKTLLSHHKLLRVIKLGIDMFKEMELPSLLRKAEIGIKDLMICDKSVIYVMDNDAKEIYRFDENQQRISYSFETGIVGYVASTGHIVDAHDPSSNHYFNSLVDLNTSLPILTLPIKNSKKDEEMFGVLQVLNLKFFGGMANGKTDTFDTEIIRMFTLQLAVSIERIQKIQKMFSSNPQFQFRMQEFAKSQSLFMPVEAILHSTENQNVKGLTSRNSD